VLAGTLEANVSACSVVVTAPGVTELAGTLPASVSASSVIVITPGVTVLAGTLLASVSASNVTVTVDTTDADGTELASVNALSVTVCPAGGAPNRSSNDIHSITFQAITAANNGNHSRKSVFA
jgi:hypothetical protein